MILNHRWNGYNYFPYEKDIAKLEIRELYGQEPTSDSGGLSVIVNEEWEESAYRTTYFKEIISESGIKIIPLQTLLELSANGTKVNRQITRYSAHGLHEYRGKFNPQIVRAIGNLFQLKQTDLVLDPFCGSGTTLLESFHNNWNAVGVDSNPLAIEIAKAKIRAMQMPISEIIDSRKQLLKNLSRRTGSISFFKSFNNTDIKKMGVIEWQDNLPDLYYLQKWFRDSVLIQLSLIKNEIDSLESKDARLVMSIILSDLLRKVSLQDEGDLRIRRQKNPPLNEPLIPLFINDLNDKIEKVLHAREHIQDNGTYQIGLLGDSRELCDVLDYNNMSELVGSFDAAITSPPYAMALPYVDTQRLSLVALGLVHAKDIHRTGKKLIGNREISKKDKNEIESLIDDMPKGELPRDCISLCRKMKEGLSDNDGFRKANNPALLYKYFNDMSLMFNSVRNVLKSGASFALLIGQNKTTIGGKTININTPRLLGLIGEQKGFEIKDNLELNTYQRYSLHQSNSIRSEYLLVLKVN